MNRLPILALACLFAATALTACGQEADGPPDPSPKPDASKEEPGKAGPRAADMKRFVEIVKEGRALASDPMSAEANSARLEELQKEAEEI
ncbi:MAG: hypothetical protein ACYTAF_11395, partial [Planctomycetota bacterium]